MNTTTTTASSSAPLPSATFLTRHRAHNSNLLWASTSAAGAGLCFLILLVIAAVWIHPKSRKHLDRVSFRLVTTALICNMFYGIFSTVGGMSKGPSKTCGFSVFVLQLTLQMSTLLLYFIALNLQLILVHHMTGPRLEKLYIIASVLLSLIITIPPYANGQYGWDDLEQDCWYTSTEKKDRLAWQIATQIVWMALIVVAELFAVFSVFLYMLRHHVCPQRSSHLPYCLIIPL
jgi:hypothetical protein